MNGHGPALWAGLTALFTNLAAVQLLAIIGSDDDRARAIAALISAFIVAGAVYSKTRLDEVKEAKERCVREHRE